MTTLYENTAVREMAEKLVRSDVYACASYMVSAIAKAGDEGCDLMEVDYEQDLLPLLELEDWEETAQDAIGREWDRSELTEYLEVQGCMDIDDAMPLDELRAKAIKEMEEQGVRKFCDSQGIEPYRIDIYEHWIVSDWLASKLKEKGHATGDLFNLTIWGRPTTGQAISMDNVMLEIARDLIASN